SIERRRNDLPRGHHPAKRNFQRNATQHHRLVRLRSNGGKPNSPPKEEKIWCLEELRFRHAVEYRPNLIKIAPFQMQMTERMNSICTQIGGGNVPLIEKRESGIIAAMARKDRK